MPQMAPISWLILFFMFAATFMLFNFLNFFSIVPAATPIQASTKIPQISMNWKW